MCTYQCVSSGWLRPCTCCKVDALIKETIRKCVSHLGIPSPISSNWGTHFPGPVIQALVKAFQTSRDHLCHRPQSSAKVERSTGILKLKIAKLAKTPRLHRPKLLPPVLLSVHRTPINLGTLRKESSFQKWSQIGQGLSTYNSLLIPCSSMLVRPAAVKPLIYYVVNRLKRPDAFQINRSCWSYSRA